MKNNRVNPCTGFLYGAAPTLDPEGDGSRISSNISQYTYPPSAYFSPVQLGALFPGAPTVVQGGAASYISQEDQTLLSDVGVRSAGCLDNCTMGGCADPTSSAHDACVLAGCCGGGGGGGETFAAPLLNSQRATSATDCLAGAAAYCASDLDYFNCHPWSTRSPRTDNTCTPATRPRPLPWA